MGSKKEEMEVEEDCIGEDGGVPLFSRKTLEPPNPLTFWKGSSWAKFRLLPDDEHRPFVPTYLNDLIERAGGRIVSGKGSSGKGKVTQILDERYLMKKLDDPACVGKKVPKNTYSTRYIHHAIYNKKRGRNPPDKKAYLLDSSQTIREVLMAAMEPDPDEDGDEGSGSDMEYEEMEYSDSEEYEDMDRKPSSSKKIQRSTPAGRARTASTSTSASKRSKTTKTTIVGSPKTYSAQGAQAPTIPNGNAASTSVPTVAGSLIKSRSATSVAPTNATSSSSKEVSKASTSAMPSGDPKPAGNSGETVPPRPRVVPVAVVRPSISRRNESETRTEPRNEGGGNPRSIGGSDWIDVGYQDQESDDNIEFSDLMESEGETSRPAGIIVDPPRGGGRNALPIPRSRTRAESPPGARGRRRPHKMEYTPGEDKKIVKMIFDRGDAYKWTTGRTLWKRMESSDEFSGNRTWQSLENRWRRTIVPRLMCRNIEYISNYYRITQHQVRNFQEFRATLSTQQWGCPDDVRF